MFPRTSNGQKPVDMFLANLKTVDMFLEPKVRTGIMNIPLKKTTEIGEIDQPFR